MLGMGDLLTKEGAEAIKRTLQDKWPDDRYDLVVRIIQKKFTPKVRSRRFDVESNMVNGLPPRKSTR